MIVSLCLHKLILIFIIFHLSMSYIHKLHNFKSVTINNGAYKYRNIYHSVVSLNSPVKLDLDHKIEERSHQYYMKLALRHAQFAFREKEVPIGAVIVDASGDVIAASRNRVESSQDASCHAEIDVLRKASQLKSTWRLQDCTLYTTLEPCAMCLGAIQSFRIKQLVYGADDHRLGACGSWVDLIDINKHPFHQVNVIRGVLADESSNLLKSFFQSRRRENSSFSNSFRGSNFDKGSQIINADTEFKIN